MNGHDSLPDTGGRQNPREIRQLLPETGLQALFDNLPYFAWVKDAQNRYVSANVFFLNHFHLTPDQLAGKTDFDIWPADFARRLSDDSLVAITRAETVDSVEHTLYSVNEARRYRSVHIPLFGNDGEILGTAGTTRDVTLEKSTEERLRKSEEKFSKFFYSSPNWLLVATVNEGRYIDVNDAFCRMTGYTREEVIGKTSIEFGLWQDPAAREHVVSMLQNHGRFDTYPCTFRMRDGSLRDFLWSAVSIEQGGEYCAISTLMDVTEFEQARRDRERLNQQLNHIQKMKAIGTLAGGIAHDLNNLLTGIKGRNSLLQAQEQLQPDLRQGLEEIDTYVDSAASLTGQLLGFARGGKYEVTSTDLNQLIEKTASLFGRTRRELVISLSLDHTISPILADRNQMEQIFLNLYINAWQAMEGRHGTLRIDTSEVVVDESRARAIEIEPGRFIKIIVADTGKGMDEDTASRIFEPFFSTKTRGQGTGLGLASVYGIVRNHHGSICVHSIKNRGTTFTLHLPAESEARPSPLPLRGGRIVRGQGRILFVDDESYILEVGTELLASLGYEVVPVTSAQKALEVFSADDSGFDLVIFDMIMPGMSGEELFSLLKLEKPDGKYLLSSGYSIDGQAAKIMAKGCDGFIQKPFGIQEISDKISEILRH